MLNLKDNAVVCGDDNFESVVSCELTQTPTSIALSVKDVRGVIIATIGFSAKEHSTEVGFEIVKSAMVAWMMGKFRKSLAMNLHFDIDPRSQLFLETLRSDVISELDDARISQISPHSLVDIETPPVTPIDNEVWIGNSGGRDSFASAALLTESGYKLHNYTISYDHQDPQKDYSTHDWSKTKDDMYHEPFDIPVTYLAPTWRINDTVPQYLAIGHSFDVLGYHSSRRKAPYESPRSMQIHQDYLRDMLGDSVRFTYPIATLSTHGVFELIRRRFGIDALESRVSCWNDENSDCGYCEKCQRIKLASSSMHDGRYQYLRDMPQVVDSHSYLFGNPAYDDLVERFGSDYLADCQLFTDDLECNDRIAAHLRRTFTKSHRVVDSNGDAQPDSFDGSPEEISNRIGINYDTLRKDVVNDQVTLLPYEEYFERDAPVASCYGELPQFKSREGWSFKRVSDGPRLEIPDTPLFRKFFHTSDNE